jgi:hypothetical protein
MGPEPVWMLRSVDKTLTAAGNKTKNRVHVGPTVRLPADVDPLLQKHSHAN